MKSVVICCSQRFKNEANNWKKKLERLGIPIVMIPDFRWRSERKLKYTEKQRLRSVSYRRSLPGLVRGHLHKIQKADVIFVLNIDGYIGVNTTLEIGAAALAGKFIFALEHDPIEPCRGILFDRIVKTPDELAHLLR